MNASLAIRFTGALARLGDEGTRTLIERGLGVSAHDVIQRTTAIVERVRTGGDDALRALAREFDHVTLSSLEVPSHAWDAALTRIPSPVRTALERAAANIGAVHEAQRPRPVEVEPEPGVRVGRRPDPLHRVGIYAPGGRAAYPSSLLMGAVPARIAGVAEVIVCTPPGKEGAPSDLVLAAAAVARVDRVFALGGAGAVAALAFGTPSVPRVERILGPGNAYVAEAKRQVQGTVTIDSPAGPSDLLAVVDAHADLDAVAHELLAQAEHDEDACVVALVEGAARAEQVCTRLLALLEKAPRRAIAAQALASRSAVLHVERLEDAWRFAEAFAPEHLLLATQDPAKDFTRVRNAGTVFLGTRASVAFGDYLTGANHVLPTGGTARSYSGLSLLEFYRWTTWQSVTPEAAARLTPDVIALAQAEGLFAHANAAALAGKKGAS